MLHLGANKGTKTMTILLLLVFLALLGESPPKTRGRRKTTDDDFWGKPTRESRDIFAKKKRRKNSLF